MSSLRKEALKHFDARARQALKREVAALREHIRRLKKTRENALAKAAHSCRSSRKRASKRAAEVIATAKAEARTIREAAKTSCQRSKAKAAKTSLAELRAATQDLIDRRSYARVFEPGKRKATTSKAERKSETDDEVRANIAPELVPLWNLVKDDIPAQRGRSRTEAFLEWVEAHPEESQALLGDHSALQARDEIRRHERELEQIDKALRKKRLTSSDLRLLGVRSHDMEALGLQPTDPQDVLAYLDLRATVAETPDTPF